jgi:hypothetical protein
MFFDHAIANDDFIIDLEDTIRFREQVLKDFEKKVSSIIKVDKEEASAFLPVVELKASKAVPVFREEVSYVFYFAVETLIRLIQKWYKIELIKSNLLCSCKHPANHVYN